MSRNVMILSRGHKTINVLSDHIARNSKEGTDAFPMFVIRFCGAGYFCKSFRSLSAADHLRAVCGIRRPLSTVLPGRANTERPVVAWLETDAPIEMEINTEFSEPVELSSSPYYTGSPICATWEKACESQ